MHTCIQTLCVLCIDQGFIWGGGGGGQRGAFALDPKCPPLDFDFILPHSLVVDAAPPYISNTLVCPPLIKCLDETL